MANAAIEKSEQISRSVSDAPQDGWIAPPAVALADGTHIQLFKDGQAMRAAYDAIQFAKNRICLEVYIFRGDSTGMAFAELLAKKARQGVPVYVIYDSFGSLDTPETLFAMMRAAGVRLRAFHPIWPWESKFGWRPINRDHRKLLLIDDAIAGVGGLNIGGEYAGSSIIHTETRQRCRDNGVAIIGPGAALLNESFNRTWNYINSGGRIRRVEYLQNVEAGELGLLASAPTVNSPLLPFLHRLFREARHSIYLTIAYFAPDDGLIEELCKAAKRGVRVRLMLAGQTDIRFLRIAAQSFYETLLNNGVHIFELQGSILHAKTMVIDEKITIAGSTNLDYRSIEYNCELSMIIRNPEFGAQMKALFLHDMQHSRRITLNRWRYRPTRDRIVQWAVSRARYLL